MAGLEQRVAELEREVAQLKTGLDATSTPKDSARASRPRTVEDAGTRVTYPVELSSFKLPNEADLKKLFDIVLQRFSQLHPQEKVRTRVDFTYDDDPDGFKDFCNAVLRFGNLGRAVAPNSKYAISWWLQECNDWLSARGLPKVSKAGPFIAAVIAHGDIGYVPAIPNEGQVWEFALEPYSGGRPATDAWRKVLRGELLAPMRPKTPRAQPLPAQILVTGQN